MSIRIGKFYVVELLRNMYDTERYVLSLYGSKWAWRMECIKDVQKTTKYVLR